jgi:alpha-galactosidase/6-phospho-beta-glucosidase family protein
MKPAEIKIAYLGGGSRQWARMFMADLALAPRLRGGLALHDLDHAAAERNACLGTALFARREAAGRFRVEAVRRQADALRGADVVVISTEPGPVTMRYADLVIPGSHGIVQPVGDTTGPGGLMRALRAVPVYAEFGRAIAAHCPRAWVINYTNPMTLCTAALHAGFPGVRAFGCCHEVFHTQTRLAGLVAEWFGVPPPARDEIALDVAGVNHFTWATAASWRGHDLFPHLTRHVAAAGRFRSAAARARQHRRQERWFDSPGLIAFDLFRRHGALGAAGDRHLAEFLPAYCTDEATLHRWGVVLTPYAWRVRHRGRHEAAARDFAAQPLRPSGEEGVRQIEALFGFAPLVTNVNLPNRGQVAELPAGAVVETMARFDRRGIRPVRAGALPATAAALVRRTADGQALALGAALRRDPAAAFAALLADPLMHLPVDRAWRMFRAMLRHCRPELPGWRIP